MPNPSLEKKRVKNAMLGIPFERGVSREAFLEKSTKRKRGHSLELICEDSTVMQCKEASWVDTCKDALDNIDWDKVRKKFHGASEIFEKQIQQMYKLLEHIEIISDDSSKRMNLYTRAMREYLGVSGNDVYNVDVSFDRYEMYLSLFAFTKLIEEELKCDKIYAVEEEVFITPTYSKIQIDHNKFYSVLTDGWCWIKYKGVKCVIKTRIFLSGSPAACFDVYVRKEDAKRAEEIIDVIKDYMRERNFYCGKKLEVHANGFFVITPPTGKSWNDIVINDTIKGEIDDNIIQLMNNREVYEANGISMTRGVILEGNYGLGKTLLCQVLCDLVNGTVFYMSPKAMVNPEVISYIYDTAVEFAKSGIPSLIILEDMDLYGQDRDSGNNLRDGVLGELMNQLNGIDDKYGVVTIGTTNRIEVIEKALKNRPGRFDRVLHFEFPDENQKLEILRHLVAKHHTNGGLTLEQWSKKANEFSGAHLADLVKTAVMEAIKCGDFITKKSKKVKLSDIHFEKAFDRINKVPLFKVGFRR